MLFSDTQWKRDTSRAGQYALMYILLFALWKIGLWCRFCSPVCFVSDAVFSQKHRKENTSSELAPFSLARKQGSYPFRVLTQWIKNEKESKQRLEIDVSVPNLSYVSPQSSVFTYQPGLWHINTWRILIVQTESLTQTINLSPPSFASNCLFLDI